MTIDPHTTPMSVSSSHLDTALTAEQGLALLNRLANGGSPHIADRLAGEP